MEHRMQLTSDQLAHRFGYHPPDTQAKKDRHEAVRDACLLAANSIVDLTGAMSREQSLAITKLEEAMMWANAAIARELPPAPYYQG
jgi:hypothetical protein